MKFNLILLVLSVAVCPAARRKPGNFDPVILGGRHTAVRFTLNTYVRADKSQKREAVEMVARGLMDPSELSKTDKRS